MSCPTAPVEPTPVARPQGCTNFKLRQLMRRVASRYDVEVGRVGLKATQYSLLSYVKQFGPIRPVDLAAGMNVDASTLSRNLRPLVAAGWLVLAPGADARSRLVAITPAGLAKRAQAQQRWRVAQEGLNAVLGPERVLALHALIDEAMRCLDGEESPRAEGADAAEDARLAAVAAAQAFAQASVP